jgi:hypothetical protein
LNGNGFPDLKLFIFVIIVLDRKKLFVLKIIRYDNADQKYTARVVVAVIAGVKP